MEKRELYRILSDFFAVPGLLCLFWGVLRWLASEGAFQGVSYLLKNALCLLTFRDRKPYQQTENRRRTSRPLLVASVIFLAVSGIFTGLYYR